MLENYISKPVQVSSGSKLLFISAIIGLVNSLIIQKIKNLDTISIPIALTISILTFTLMLFFIYQMSLRKKWARTTFLILFIIGATTFLFTLVIIVRTSLVIGITTILLTLLQIISLSMLYSKAANRWFRL